MPPGVMTSVRLDPELAAWLLGYAKKRGVSRSALIEAALRGFRELAATGVPVIEASESAQAPTGFVGESEFQRDAREQAELAHPTGPGVGNCPQSPGGHEWSTVSGKSECIHCGGSGAEFLDAATEQRARLFGQVRAPKSVREGKAAKS